jgi:electron transport complex protein RnfB
VTPIDIDALLPQTQCTRCGYNGCLPYAEALASGEAALNRCPPGGAALIGQLAALLQRPALPLDPECGAEKPWPLVWIDPAQCIGCARCLPPCPVDAIVGTQKQLHTVIADWCTGCELCIAACPVDCIHLVARPGALAPPPPDESRRRYQQHNQRWRHSTEQRAELLAERKRAARRTEPRP